MRNPYRPGGMRRFRLDELIPFTGEYRCFAQGVVFGDGTTVVNTLDNEPKTNTCKDISEVEQLSRIGIRIRWEDKCCFQCGVGCDNSAGAGWCLSCGASWSEPSDMPDPSKGSWVKALTLESEK